MAWPCGGTFSFQATPGRSRGHCSCMASWQIMLRSTTSLLGMKVQASSLATSSMSFSVSTACWHTVRWCSVSCRIFLASSKVASLITVLSVTSPVSMASSTHSQARSASASTAPTTFRISWYTCAETVRCAASAASASIFFSSKSRAARISVMSCPMPTTPITLPCSSRREVAFSRISTRLPSLVISGKSKLAVSTPRSALSSTLCTEVL
mmetsp:Transcript_57028/g.131188  ORF Transcript_57028/g.131188 Transcript_57028/m.131188 type:complete len:210 (-) Transcript_57028:824-1453(-)